MISCYDAANLTTIRKVEGISQQVQYFRPHHPEFQTVDELNFLGLRLHRRMISINRAAVPEHLRDSEFYRSLSPAENDTFDVPQYALKQSPTVVDVTDLTHLLESLRYWMVEEPPTELVVFCLGVRTVANDCKEALNRYRRELPYVTWLARYVGNDLADEPQMRDALRTGSITIVKYLWNRLESKETAWQFAQSHFLHALEGDNVDCLAFVISKGCPVEYYGAYARSVVCFDYLLAHCPSYRPNFDDYVRNDMIVLVRCLLTRGFTWTPDTLRCCVTAGALVLLRYLHEQGCCQWDGVTAEACEKSRLDILQYAHEHGALWDASCMRYVVSLDCMVYAHEHGCPWHPQALRNAVVHQNWECFEYALKHGCPYTADVATAAVVYCLPMFKYLRAKPYYPWDAVACMSEALYGNDLELVRYLREEGAPWPHDALVIIAAAGSVKMLQFAHGDGLSLENSSEALDAAIEGHKLRVVRFLHQKGCPWDHTAVQTAVRCWARDCLEYLLQHGCPIVPFGYPADKRAYLSHPMYIAAQDNRFTALQILFRYGHRLRLTPQQRAEAIAVDGDGHALDVLEWYCDGPERREKYWIALLSSGLVTAVMVLVAVAYRSFV
jgi:hypothetical protein